MKPKYYLIILLLYIYPTLCLQPQWENKLDLLLLEQKLAQEKIIAQEPLQTYFNTLNKNVSLDDFSNSVITLESGLKAIFKPSQSCYAEVAAYKASNLLELKLVPPTVLRTINTVVGSLQLLIEPAQELERALLSQKQLASLDIFYYIFGQWDNHCDNTLMQIRDTSINIACIDNAAFWDLQFCNYGDFPFVYSGGDLTAFYQDKELVFPFQETITLHTVTYEKLSTLFSNYLPETRIKRLSMRNKKITYCIWHGCLWLQTYKHCSWAHPNFSAEIPKEIIDSYKKLDKQLLHAIWADVPNKKRVKKLIKLTLRRKKEVLDCYSKMSA